MSLPIGSIIMFYDALANRPIGWELCNGSNGTPDLRSKFIYAASSDGEVGNTGGGTTHTHTNPSTGANASHGHSVSGSLGSASGVATPSGAAGISVGAQSHTHSSSDTLNSVAGHQHTVTDTNAGSSLPPYVKIYFIMRVV